MKKLNEFADYLKSLGKMTPKGKSFSVEELLGLLQKEHEHEKDKYFGGRLQTLVGPNVNDLETLPAEMREILSVPLPDFEKYMELLFSSLGKTHRQNITKAMDSLLMKNRPGAFLFQSRARYAPRKFILDSRLLEVLLQLAVVKPGGKIGFYTDEIPIDAGLRLLRKRYGLYIDRLPFQEGFDEPDILQRKALRGNLESFKRRLREIGFYQDVSDASVTQRISPRYKIGEASSDF